MKRISRLTAAFTTCIVLATQTSVALSDTLVSASMQRIPAAEKSGSGHTVLQDCAGSKKTKGWSAAQATLRIDQNANSSTVRIDVSQAAPDTLYTVWLRLAGSSAGNEWGGQTSIGPSPMTGGGATPLLSSNYLDQALLQSPPLEGSAIPVNGFKTDAKGAAIFVVALDYPVIGGSFPFHRASTDAVKTLREAGSKWPLVRSPAPIVNPDDSGISAPFMIRVVSHCQDQLGHGLSPSNREPWFQWPQDQKYCN